MVRSTFPFLSAVIGCLLLIQTTTAKIRHNNGQLCTFDNEYICSPMSRQMWGKIDIPVDACYIHNCENCVITHRTFVMTKNYQLHMPSEFILKQITTDKDTHSTTYECHNEDRTPCECAENGCGGALDFCTIRNCTSDSKCRCRLTYNKVELIAITSEETIYNPEILIMKICFFDKNKELTHGIHRKLLEGERALFSDRNLSITFEDPILFLPDKGRVILRSTDFENVMTIPDDKMITIPFEYLAYKTQIQVIYLHPNGQTISGIIHVNGKTVCQIKQCFLCKEVFNHFRCYPTFIQIAIYSAFAILIILLLASIKFMIKTTHYIIKSMILVLYGLFKLSKGIARCSLLLGSFIGSTIREFLQKGFQVLERHAARRAEMNIAPLVMLTLLCVVSPISADCNTHSIIKSELRTCESLNDGTKTCNVFTTAEISLQTISSETCLWFTDSHDNHLFSLKIKLEAVLCTFHKERLYFTFPVKSKQLSQISCIFNKYCGRGVHCIKRSLGKEGLKFEAETPESREFPGFSACSPGGLGVGCALLHRASCNFYRVWYEPQLINTYEVSEIRGHSCQYQISVTHVENNTMSRLLLSDTAITDSGIKITILGAYDQPQLHIQDKLIQRVGRPNEAFLAPASERNIPQANMVGAVQANTSFTTDFIFDPTMSVCDYFEDRLRCIHAPDSIARLQATQEYALPLQRDIHLFQIKDDKLQSSLIMSSAVRVQLHFSNLKLTLHTTNVCPQMEENSIQTSGCHSCSVLARLTIKAYSSCQPGTVTVHFQQTNVHTKAIYLKTEPTLQVIKFHTDVKCSTEKICLKSSTLMQCRTFKMCLDEPSVELLQLNLNYTQVQSSQTASSIWDWFQLPKLQAPMFLLKLIGSALFIICLLITTLATLITCCCRSR